MSYPKYLPAASLAQPDLSTAGCVVAGCVVVSGTVVVVVVVVALVTAGCVVAGCVVVTVVVTAGCVAAAVVVGASVPSHFGFLAQYSGQASVTCLPTMVWLQMPSTAVLPTPGLARRLVHSAFFSS